MPRLLLVALDYVLLLLDPKRVVAAKGGVSLLPHQQDLQPSPFPPLSDSRPVDLAPPEGAEHRGGRDGQPKEPGEQGLRADAIAKRPGRMR